MKKLENARIMELIALQIAACMPLLLGLLIDFVLDR
jgi:hypothetical protein